MAPATGRGGFSAALALAALLLAGTASPGPFQTREEGLQALVPAGQAAPGWSRDGEPQEFVGEDLYTYIDGGAEIYQEYGFRRVAVQDYKNAAGKSVSLEIFEMQTPEAAFGMFTFKRSGKGKAVPLGAGGELEDYYLNFWKGRFLVTLTGFDSDPATLAGLQAVAAAVDNRIVGEREPPGLTVLLPKEGLRVESIKYLKGTLGLNNVYSLHTARGLDFDVAVKGDYGDGTTLIVMSYPIWSRWESSLLGLWKSLDQSEKFKRVAEGVYQDDKGRFLAVSGLPLWIAIGLGPDASSARKRMDSASTYLIRSVSR